ncbi:hypothetical protein [Luedemannella helvata]|uniref:Uncharacterized protein n=1 Tax=Luedemannella helvata TaxID=349315 RepID=A0ABN2K1V2_9ACTN
MTGVLATGRLAASAAAADARRAATGPRTPGEAPSVLRVQAKQLGIGSEMLNGVVPERLLKAAPHHRRWVVSVAAVAVVTVIAVCGVSLRTMFLDAQQDTRKTAVPPTSAPPTRDISDRKVDPKAMTVADVFPSKQIEIGPGVPNYAMIGNAQVLKDCRAGATGELGKMLRSLGCNQLIRATARTEDKNYLVTFGVFNLKDDVAARQAHEEIKTYVDQGKGRFTGYISTSATKVLGRAPTQLAWDADGHFLVYCVIARSDGKEFTKNDPYPRVIIYDTVETYLRDKVIANWALDKDAMASAAPTPSPPASGG